MSSVARVTPPMSYLALEESAPIKRRKAEVYRRRNGFEREVIETDQPLTLECVGLTLSVSGIYSAIDLGAPAQSET